jgi:Nicotinamide mononucleotide adenylyltransferase
MAKKVAGFFGRWNPEHKGHVIAQKMLLEKYDRLVIGMGSCYEGGVAKHALLSPFREKIVLASLEHEGIDLSRVDIPYIQDFPNNDKEWAEHVARAVKKYGITHFITGNEWVIKALSEYEETKGLEFTNPELTSGVPFHATDLRNAILNDDYETFREMAAHGTIKLLGNIGGFDAVKEAIKNEAYNLQPNQGVQTADVVFTTSKKVVLPAGDIVYKDYVLCGKRTSKNEQFSELYGITGDVIQEFESPLIAALRALKEKAGIETQLLSNTTEPAMININIGGKYHLGFINFLKLYNSKDKRFAGDKGGSSFCFYINMIRDPKDFTNITDTDKMSNMQFVEHTYLSQLDFAYDQQKMIEDTIQKVLVR